MGTMSHIYCSGPVANDVLVRFDSRMLLFTGSQGVAEKLSMFLARALFGPCRTRFASPCIPWIAVCRALRSGVCVSHADWCLRSGGNPDFTSSQPPT